MMRKVEIKAIVFDLGNVLCDIDVRSPLEKLKHLSTVSVENQDTVSYLMRMHRQFMSGFYSGEEFLHILRSNLGISLKPDKIKEIWNEIIVGIREEFVPLLTYLKKQYMVYLLSNTDSIHMEKIRHTNPEFFSYFHELFLSYELGCVKPDEKIYNKLLEMSGLEASHIIFFDDTPENISIAGAMGFHAFQADSLNQILTILKKYGILDGRFQRREE